MRPAATTPPSPARDGGSAIEAPSGKGAGDENFPVASHLVARRLRPHVHAFYAFARAADDIADSPSLTPDEKLRRLDLFEAGLAPGAAGPEKALRLRRSLNETGVGDRHARALLQAFRMDAVKRRYADWDDLAGYCRLSAHPVGRFMLELHGEGEAPGPASDALTAALQVLNHLQDLGQDYRALDRIYLPGDWMQAEGVAEADLAADRASPGLRGVIDRCLDGCDVWLAQADPLPRLIGSRRLGAEAAVIRALARRLSRRLRRQDPLAGRVRLTRADVAAAVLAGLGRLAPRR